MSKGKRQVRSCRVCGCTDDHACDGGCHWITEDVCSACVVPAHLLYGPGGIDNVIEVDRTEALKRRRRNLSSLRPVTIVMSRELRARLVPE